MTEATKREILDARDAGLSRTKYRKFRGWKERVGAMLCCRLGCRKPSVYVSYDVDFPSRGALCEKHHEKEPKP